MLAQASDEALRQIVNLIYAESQAQGITFDTDERKILAETAAAQLPEEWIEKFEEEQDWESFSQKVKRSLRAAEREASRSQGPKGKKAFREMLELASKSGTYLGGTIAIEMLDRTAIVSDLGGMVVATITGSVLLIGAIYGWLVFSPTPAGHRFSEFILSISQRVTIPIAIAAVVTFAVWWLFWQKR